MLPRQRRLTSSREFKTVFTGGRTYTNRLIILKILPVNSVRSSRFAFSTSTKIGTRVDRNRTKRLLREAVRSVLSRVRTNGYDAVLIARAKAREAGLAEIVRAAMELLGKAGLVVAEDGDGGSWE